MNRFRAYRQRLLDRLSANAEDQPRDAMGRFAAVDSETRHNYHKWVSDLGHRVELRHSTVYSKRGNLRDESKTKQVAVVDLNGQEHKAFSVKGESRESRQALSDKVEKHLARSFGISHKMEQ